MATKAKKEAVVEATKETKKVTKKATAVKAEAKEVKPVKKTVVKKTVKKAEAEIEKTEEAVAEKTVKETEVKKVKTDKSSVSPEELFEAGAHFGHVVKKWNPKMKKYLWGEKNGIHIFDLEKTIKGIEEASKALSELAAAGKRVVLVGTKRQVRQLIEDEAKRIGVPFITQRWLGGLITNWKQIKQTLDRLNSLKTKRDTGQLKKFTKKEQVLFDKEIARLERLAGGIASMKESPEVVVVFDTHKEKLAVKEASSRGVTVIGLVDSNSNPDPVDYVIPMNDDSAKGLEILVRVLGQAIENGLKLRKEVSK